MKAILFFYVIIYLLLTCSKPEPRQPDIHNWVRLKFYTQIYTQYSE